MTEPRPKAGFSDVDRAGEPADYVRLLDLQHETAFIQEYKLRTLEMLGLREGERALEVGAGVGVEALAMARQVAPVGEVIGLDSSQTMVDEATRRHGASGAPVRFVQGDVYHLPFADASFDACRADKTLQHLADPEAALREMARITKPGGRLLVVDPDHETRVIDTPYTDVTRRFFAFRADTIQNAGVAHHAYALLREAGLVDVVVEAHTQISTDYQEINRVMSFDGGIRLAAQQGVVTADETERWIASLEWADRAGRFFHAITYFITMGRKPS